MRTCPNCNASVTPDLTSCNSCGTTLSQNQNAGGFCRKCGAVLSTKYTSCPQCGHVKTMLSNPNMKNSSSQTIKWIIVVIVAVICTATIVGAVGIVGIYSMFAFLDQSQSGVLEGPPDAGPLGSAHTHTAMLVKIFTDKFDFSTPAYQIRSSWIHFEGSDGSTIHRHAEGVTLGDLFESLALGIDEECFVFTDGRKFCSDDQYSLVYYVNGVQVPDIREYEPRDNDRILISYGAETPEQLESELLEIASQKIVK